VTGRARHVGAPLSDREEKSIARREEQRERKHARVTTDPVPGSDPTPDPEPARSELTENDERLNDDKPPHY
jgi:hypothetical protein